MLAATLLGIFCASLVAFAFLNHSRSVQWVQHSYQARAAVGGILQAVLDAEDSERGFLLTGQEAYLGHFEAARQQVVESEREARLLLADNPAQLTRLDRVRGLVEVRLEHIDTIVALAGEGRTEQAVSRVGSNLGWAYTESLRTLLGEMDRDERVLLGQRLALEQRTEYLLGGIIVLAGLFWVLCLRQIKRRARADKVRDRADEAVLDRALDRLGSRALMADETHHRIKNSLQMLSSLLWVRIPAIADPAAREALVETARKLAAIARVHEHLCRDDGMAEIDAGACLADLCGEIAASSDGGSRIEVRAAPVRIPAADIQPLALLVNELVANAMKHGRKPGRTPVIRVLLAPAGQGFRLSVLDNGPGLPRGFRLDQARDSLGLKIVQALASQLGASFGVRSGSWGAGFTLVRRG